MKDIFQGALFDELAPLYPDTNIAFGSKELMICAASNTYAGVHILLNGLTPGTFVTIEVNGPLKKHAINQEGNGTIEQFEQDHRYKFFELLSVPVEVNTGAKTRTEWTVPDINPNVIRRAPFMIYDVLKPCTNVIPAKGNVMALAFRCKVDCQKHEVQKWTMMICHNGVSQKLEFFIDVYPIKVPSVTKDDFKYVNWIGGEAISRMHHVPYLSGEWYGFYEQYIRLARYGRQNIVHLTADMMFDYDGSNTPALNEKKLDKLLEIVNRVGYFWIEGPHLAGRKDNEWMATEAETVFSKKIIPGEGEKDLLAMCSQLYDYILKHDLEERWIQSVMDEPIDCLENTYRMITEIAKKAMPGIKILDATISTEKIVGTVDIWCPTVDQFEENEDFFNSRSQQGEEIFVYTCLNPAGNYVNRLQDQERLRQVYIGWSPVLYPNISGFLHWGGMNIQDHMDPFYLSAPLPDITDYDAKRSGTLPAGDSAIMYPGFRTVYSSTRLEAHRIGFEDLVLLEKLKQANPEKAIQLVRRIFNKYDDYSKEIGAYRDAKKMLLDEVCAL